MLVERNGRKATKVVPCVDSSMNILAGRSDLRDEESDARLGLDIGVIDDQIRLTVPEIQGHPVRLGMEVPKRIPIPRGGCQFRGRERRGGSAPYKWEDFAGAAKVSSNRQTSPGPQMWAFFPTRPCFWAILGYLLSPRMVLLWRGLTSKLLGAFETEGM